MATRMPAGRAWGCCESRHRAPLVEQGGEGWCWRRKRWRVGEWPMAGSSGVAAGTEFARRRHGHDTIGTVLPPIVPRLGDVLHELHTASALHRRVHTRGGAALRVRLPPPRAES